MRWYYVRVKNMGSNPSSASDYLGNCEQITSPLCGSIPLWKLAHSVPFLTAEIRLLISYHRISIYKTVGVFISHWGVWLTKEGKGGAFPGSCITLRIHNTWALKPNSHAGIPKEKRKKQIPLIHFKGGCGHCSLIPETSVKARHNQQAILAV